MKHLFETLDLENFDEKDIITSLQEDLNKSDVSITVRWTNKRNIVFYKLHLKQNGKTVALLNGSALNESSGTYTFYIGSFDKNADIEISYGFLALVSIPKLVVILTQTNPTIGFQCSPKDPGVTNKIETGGKLAETVKYKIQ